MRKKLFKNLKCSKEVRVLPTLPRNLNIKVRETIKKGKQGSTSSPRSPDKHQKKLTGQLKIAYNKYNNFAKNKKSYTQSELVKIIINSNKNNVYLNKSTLLQMPIDKLKNKLKEINKKVYFNLFPVKIKSENSKLIYKKNLLISGILDLQKRCPTANRPSLSQLKMLDEAFLKSFLKQLKSIFRNLKDEESKIN